MMYFRGMLIIEEPSLTVMVEDWSKVRSPARARRRRRKYPQRIAITARPSPDVYRVGDRLIMHPEIAKELRARAETME